MSIVRVVDPDLTMRMDGTMLQGAVASSPPARLSGPAADRTRATTVEQQSHVRIGIMGLGELAG